MIFKRKKSEVEKEERKDCIKEAVKALKYVKEIQLEQISEEAAEWFENESIFFPKILLRLILAKM